MNTAVQKLMRPIASLALLAPAILLGLAGLAGPTLSTFLLSLQKQSLITSPEFVGGQNFSRLLADKAFGSALTYTLEQMGLRLLVVAIVPVLLALAVSRFGRAVRWPVRLLFSVPAAIFAPAAVAAIWLETSAGGAPYLAPSEARSTVLLIDSLYVFGLACAAGTVVYLAALPRPARRLTSSRKLLIASWLVSLLAVAALTLQSFTLNYMLTGGGRSGSVVTVALYQFGLAFRFLNFGAAAAVASLMLVILGVLGLGAGIIIVLEGLQIELRPRSPAPLAGHSQDQPNRADATALLAVLLLISLGLGIVAARPALSSLLLSFSTGQAYQEFFRSVPVASVLANTLVPPLLAILLQLPVAYLAAFGIGAVRPLGRWSEFLLLPISPWLFVTIVPLSLVAFQNLHAMGAINTFIALIPPMPLSVPMIFVLTLFFKGQEIHWRSARVSGQSAAAATWSQLILPSLPLVLLVTAIALLVGLQEFYWPLVMASDRATMPFPVTLFSLVSQRVGWPVVAAGVTLFETPVFVLFFIVLGALQCLYVDRLALTDGRPGSVPPRAGVEAAPISANLQVRR